MTTPASTVHDTPPNSEEVILRCECHSMDHIVQVSYFPEANPEHDEMYITVHLNTSRPWYRRLLEAVRLLFKLNGRHGNWDEVILSPQSADKLIPALQRFCKRRLPCLHPNVWLCEITGIRTCLHCQRER